MFVVFEGIDGSGKTTLSGEVLKILKSEGISVHHARPKGELKSQLAKEIRILARNPRSLDMSPLTELFLYLSRDAQMIDTVIKPALSKAEVVIADRYVYSPVVLCKARGVVSEDKIDSAVKMVAGTLWPDLVVYCDVDIHTSNLRKQIAKTLSPKSPEDFGRKGLRGLGLRRRMRDEYLNMVKSNSSWMMVDNVNKSIKYNSSLIASKIISLLKNGNSYPVSFEKDVVKIKKTTSSLPPFEVRKNFYSYLNSLCTLNQEKTALYHARSLNSEEAWTLKERYLKQEPEIIAKGLEPLFCERAINIRKKLAESAPRQVARSLDSAWANESDDAWELRWQLADKVPVDVATTLGGLDSQNAWEMRHKLIKYNEATGHVLASLKRLSNEAAWRMRYEYNKKRYDFGLLEGLAGIDTPDAWKIRKKYLKTAMPWVILSLGSLDSPKAWEIREAYVAKATKLVLKSLSGMDTERAWNMREAHGIWAKEALTTIKGISSEKAFNLREKLIDVWPAFVAKSLGLTLMATDKGKALLNKLLDRHPYNPEVVHYVVKHIENNNLKDKRG
jgi:dTMP kinase